MAQPVSVEKPASDLVRGLSHPLSEDVREAPTSSSTSKDDDRLMQPSSSMSYCTTSGSTTYFSQRASSLQSFSSQASQASTLRSLSSFSPDALPRPSLGTLDDPVTIDKLKIAVVNLVTDLVPSGTQLYEKILEELPAFGEKYGTELPGKIDRDLQKIAARCREELLDSEEQNDMEAALRKIDRIKTDPKKMREIQNIQNATPESRMLDPKVRIAKSAGRALRYGEREMIKLKKEEEDKMKLIVAKTKHLEALLKRSEQLVTLTEQVADVAKPSNSELGVQQSALLDIIQWDRNPKTKRAIYTASQKIL